MSRQSHSSIEGELEEDLQWLRFYKRLLTCALRKPDRLHQLLAYIKLDALAIVRDKGLRSRFVDATPLLQRKDLVAVELVVVRCEHLEKTRLSQDRARLSVHNVPANSSIIIHVPGPEANEVALAREIDFLDRWVVRLGASLSRCQRTLRAKHV